VVAPELIGCLLVKRQPNGELLWGVVVQAQGHYQADLFSTALSDDYDYKTI